MKYQLTSVQSEPHAQHHVHKATGTACYFVSVCLNTVESLQACWQLSEAVPYWKQKSGQNLMVIHLIVIGIFQSEPKRRTDWQSTAVQRAAIKADALLDSVAIISSLSRLPLKHCCSVKFNSPCGCAYAKWAKAGADMQAPPQLIRPSLAAVQTVD